MRLPSDKPFIPRISIRGGMVQNSLIASGRKNPRLVFLRRMRPVVSIGLMGAVFAGVVIFFNDVVDNYNRKPAQADPLFTTHIRTESKPSSTFPVPHSIQSSPPLIFSSPPNTLLPEGPDNRETYRIGRHAVVTPPALELTLPAEPESTPQDD